MFKSFILIAHLILALHTIAHAQAKDVDLANIRMRDACILVDEATKTYYLISSTNKSPAERARFFELEDTGETLRIKQGR